MSSAKTDNFTKYLAHFALVYSFIIQEQNPFFFVKGTKANVEAYATSTSVFVLAKHQTIFEWSSFSSVITSNQSCQYVKHRLQNISLGVTTIYSEVTLDVLEPDWPIGIFLLEFLKVSPQKLSPSLPALPTQPLPHQPHFLLSLFLPPPFHCPSSPCIDPPDTVTVSQLQAPLGGRGGGGGEGGGGEGGEGGGGGSSALAAESLGQLAGRVLPPPYCPSSFLLHSWHKDTLGQNHTQKTTFHSAPSSFTSLIDPAPAPQVYC